MSNRKVASCAKKSAQMQSAAPVASGTGAFSPLHAFWFYRKSQNVCVVRAAKSTCFNGGLEQEEMSSCEKKGVGPPNFNVEAEFWGSTGSSGS